MKNKIISISLAEDGEARLPRSPSWLEGCDLTGPEKALIQRIINGADWVMESLVSELDECELGPREVYLWMEQVERDLADAQRDDLVYPRMREGLAIINKSHLPREQKYQLLMGIAAAENPCLSAYDDNALPTALAACSNSDLSPQRQVDLLVALAVSCGTAVIQTYQGLDKSLPIASSAFKQLDLSKDQVGDRLVLLADTGMSSHSFLSDCQSLSGAITEFQSRDWDNCLTDRTLVLLMERLGSWVPEWLAEFLAPTLDILQSDGRAPTEQFALIAALAYVKEDSETALDDTPGGFSLNSYCFDTALLSKGLDLMKKLSRELQPKVLAKKDTPSTSGADLFSEDFLVQSLFGARLQVAEMIIYPRGADIDGLFINLVERAQESLWVAINLIEALSQEGMALPDAHRFVVAFLSRIPRNIRLTVIQELLANHVPAIAEDPDSYYAEINGLGAALMGFLRGQSTVPEKPA
ncbi:MAG: hypothetical protein HQ596_03990 [Candidatus Saganbacteria bacterium]|nr:hypothetical protein [Candidatus Saganbacteria bacterium]